MNKRILRLLAAVKLLPALAAAAVLFACTQASAQVVCPVTQVTAGLRRPIGITLSNQGNLLVSETGTPVLHTGRISIVDLGGQRRTLLDGLPSGISDVGDPSGPDGLFLRGRTLYVAVGVGDVGRPGPLPGTTVPNPNGPSSPIFSSVLAIHFSANVEKMTEGFTLSLADQQALASGQRVTLSDGGSDRITIEMVVNFPDYEPFPRPLFPANIQLSNPFDLVAVGDHLYATDGGRNLVWQAEVWTHL